MTALRPAGELFSLKLEPDLRLLTVIRRGLWSVDTVRAYETALRRQLAMLHSGPRPTSCIIDIRLTDAPSPPVATALRSVVQHLGALNADRLALVTSSGVNKLEAKWIGDDTAEVFTSMVLARDWATNDAGPRVAHGRHRDRYTTSPSMRHPRVPSSE